MKSFALIVVFAQAVLLQSALGQCIKSCGCGLNQAFPILAPAPCAGPGPVVIQSVPNVIQTLPSVYQAASNVVALPPTNIAGSLADTLSLLTVSSLLAEKLPLGLPQIVNVAAPVVPSCGCGYNVAAPVIPSCGCGYNLAAPVIPSCGCGYNVAAPVIPSCGCGYNVAAPVIPSCGCGYNLAAPVIPGCGFNGYSNLLY